MPRSCMRCCVELGKQQIYPVGFTPSWELCSKHISFLFLHTRLLPAPAERSRDLMQPIAGYQKHQIIFLGKLSRNFKLVLKIF